MNRPQSNLVTAFWSYPRKRGGPGLDALFQSMERRLAEVVLPASITIFKDTDEERGIRPGADWSAELVRAAGSSILFFWNQSPLWIFSPMCIFEMELFRSRVDRVANRFIEGCSEATLDELRKSMIVPIRWHPMSPDQWQSVSGPNAQLIHRDWDLSNIVAPLDFSVPREGALPDAGFYESAAHAAMRVVKLQYEHIFELLKIKRPELLDFLATDLPDFKRYWHDQFIKRRPTIDSTAALQGWAARDLPQEWAEQRSLARQMTEGRTICQNESLALPMTLIWPSDDAAQGFWVSSGPLATSRASFWQEYMPLGGARPDNAGSLAVDEASVRHLQNEVGQFGLSLPDARQAQRLREVYALPRATLYQLGLVAGASNFWYLNEGGQLARQSERSAAAAVVLVEPLTRHDHD
ncbi:hypothetical protein B0G76_8208 [Paraburkholderia sp. BL23I1N1]|uniref:hypothetical protein n=1 Tax=Paraburkholderia sp. BL23I1N1 TaxID=1938802 RepID=UPI000E70E8D2|nr:hypothetical protein [Paraburkholderia sp. BL23I1N1]RKE24327.1 hypothetical protein B0G76_8208 [Paraburkholderia sp. BL23I1N1]